MSECCVQKSCVLSSSVPVSAPTLFRYLNQVTRFAVKWPQDTLMSDDLNLNNRTNIDFLYLFHVGHINTATTYFRVFQKRLRASKQAKKKKNFYVRTPKAFVRTVRSSFSISRCERNSFCSSWQTAYIKRTPFYSGWIMSVHFLSLKPLIITIVITLMMKQ
jgi:hypothetical protein